MCRPVHAMAKSGGNWKWPEDDGGEKDIVWYCTQKMMLNVKFHHPFQLGPGDSSNSGNQYCSILSK